METTSPTMQPGTSPDENARIIEEMQQRMNPTNQVINNKLQEAHENRIEAMRAQLHSPEPTEPNQNNPSAPNQEPQSQ